MEIIGIVLDSINFILIAWVYYWIFNLKKVTFKATQKLKNQRLSVPYKIKDMKEDLIKERANMIQDLKNLKMVLSLNYSANPKIQKKGKEVVEFLTGKIKDLDEDLEKFGQNEIS